MSRARSLFALLGVVSTLGVPRVACAQEEGGDPLARPDSHDRGEKPDRPEGGAKAEKGSEFETFHLGIRAGWWYEPNLDLSARLGGAQAGFLGQTLGNNRFDVASDLGVKVNTPRPVMFGQDLRYGTLELEAFVDSRWVSVSLAGVMPFRYEGSTTIARQLTIAGVTFAAGRRVETTLDQFLAGVEVKLNLLNDKFLRVGPLIAVRVLGIDWTFEDVASRSRATTGDVRAPTAVGGYQLLPYPEVGIEVRAGYRTVFEVDAKLSAMHIFYSGLSGTTALIEGGVTVYPLAPLGFDNLGLRLGGRYYYVNVGGGGFGDQLDANMKILGGNLSVIVRF